MALDLFYLFNNLFSNSGLICYAYTNKTIHLVFPSQMFNDLIPQRGYCVHVNFNKDLTRKNYLAGIGTQTNDLHTHILLLGH